MRTPAVFIASLLIVGWLTLSGVVQGQSPPKKPADNPYPYNPSEATARRLSFAKAGEYLDGVAEFWMRDNSCGACHANFAYLMARPALGDEAGPALAQTRSFLEQRKPNKRFAFDSEAVAIAFALAWDDAHTSGVLRPTTRQALRRMWSMQRPDGTWRQMGCGDLMPAENDRHYTATLAALAAGVAPENYAHTAEAQDGLTKLRRHFVKSPPSTVHDDAMRLWASQYLDGLMTAAEREASVKVLLGRQRADGGWSLPSLSYPVAIPNKIDNPSDGYGTGFAVYILRQAGVPASRPEIARGVAWLKGQQRASGRWVAPASVAPTEGGVGSRDLYVQNHATAFTVLALTSCDVTSTSLAPTRGRVLPDDAFTAIVRECRQQFDRWLVVPQRDLSPSGIRASALLLALAAQHRMGQADADPRQAATVRDAVLGLVAACGKQPRDDAGVARIMQLFERFPSVTPQPQAKLNHVRLRDHFDHDDVSFLFGSCGGGKGHRIERDLLQFDRQKTPLTQADVEKAGLVGYKVALVGDFLCDFDDVFTPSKPELRKQWRQHAEDVQRHGWDLAEATRSQNDNTTRNAVRTVMKACTTCHEQFRN